MDMLRAMTNNLFALGLLLPTFAIAQANLTTGTPSGWAWGLQVSDYRYEEPSLAVSLDGQQLAGSLSYTAVDERGAFGRVELRAAYGEMTYRGSGVAEDQPNQIAEGRFVAGGDLHPGGSVGLAPFIGLGYRYLYSDVRGTTSTGALGYRRYSYYFYVPLGLSLRHRTAGGWIIAPTVEYDHLIQGQQISRLSDTGIPGVGDVENIQRNGRGYRAALRIESRDMHFGPWVHYWDITNSNIAPAGPGVAGREPANSTLEWGVEFGMFF